MVGERTVEERARRATNRSRARKMRHEPTEAERLFWSRVRDRRLGGHKFKRQYTIGNYIVDFVCFEKRLIVELDGGEHLTKQAYDNAREAFLISEHFRVMRFWNHEVTADIDGVLRTILHALA